MSFGNSPGRSIVSINNSLSKQMYSFSNTPRFTMTQKMSNGFLDNLPSIKSSRVASIGIGTKTEFGKLLHSKATFYDIRNSITSMEKAPMYSFGLSREQCKLHTNLNTGIHPEPGTYSTKPMIGNHALKYSIRKKIRNKNLSLNPGPGTYNSIDFSLTYPVSHIKNNVHLPFSFSKEQRFKERSRELAPCVGTYNIPSTFNGTGVFPLSHQYSNIAKTMGARIKNTQTSNNTPGPGRYSYYSSLSGYH